MTQRLVWTLAWRYLRSRRREGFISVVSGFSFLGISLGVATLIIVMSVMQGFRQELLNRIIGFNGHICIMSATHSPLKLSSSDLRKIESLKDVKHVLPCLERPCMLSNKSHVSGAVVHGVPPQSLQNRPLIVEGITRGNIQDFKLASHSSPPVVMGEKLADRLGLSIGSEFFIVVPQGVATAFGFVPKLKKFYLTATYSVGLKEYDTSILFIPLESAKSFFGVQHPSNYEVFVDTPESTRTLIHHLKSMFPLARFLDWKEVNERFFQALRIERNVMFVILSLLILIAAFNVVSGLVMLAKDKAQDVAILMVLGASPKLIRGIFFRIGALLGLVGTAAGTLAGLAFAYNIDHIRRGLEWFLGTELFKDEIYFLSQLPCSVKISDVIGVIVVAILVSCCAPLYPAWRASRLDPLEILRHEA